MSDLPATQHTRKVSPGIIIGSILGVCTALFLGAVAWRVRQRKKSQTSVDTKTLPYPTPGAIKVREKRSWPWRKQGPFNEILDTEKPLETSSGGTNNRKNATTPRNGRDIDFSLRLAPRLPPRVRSIGRPSSATQSSIIRAIHHTGEEREAAMRQIITPAAATDVNHTTTDPERGPIFRHTDSGWRMAPGRAASEYRLSEAGSGSIVEMPPTYSEAG
ncbi:hypothetical protein PQX77_012224 [Marasmius sp. AFHP31]|nr:hypothetical protein PQX77_012224 [Marasmius sp. AFHP31]